jgi:hypothetical protein
MNQLLRCLLLLPMLATALFAQNPGMAPTNPPVSSKFSQAVAHSPKLTTIYSNLGKGKCSYGSEGWTISGSNSPVGEEVWIAMPFTPTEAAEATQIEVAVGYIEGTDEILISLDADDNGQPGKTLHSWHFKNMPKHGGPCKLDTVKDKKGIRVKAKTQYWVAVTTNASDADLWAAWDFTYNDATGPLAYEINAGGWTADNSDLGAFAVLGK